MRTFERVYQGLDGRQVRVRVEEGPDDSVYTLPGWLHSCTDRDCPDVNAEALSQLEQPGSE